jgi:magnesium-transporting ATPase (P-type)
LSLPRAGLISGYPFSEITSIYMLTTSTVVMYRTLCFHNKHLFRLEFPVKKRYLASSKVTSMIVYTIIITCILYSYNLRIIYIPPSQSARGISTSACMTVRNSSYIDMGKYCAKTMHACMLACSCTFCSFW